MEKEASKKVRVKSVSFTVYPWTHSSGKTHWRFNWYDQSGKIRFTTRADKAKAVKAARDKAKEIHNQTFDLATLSEEQARLCRAFLDLKPDWNDLALIKSQKARRTITVAAAVDEFEKHLLTGKEKLTRYQEDVIGLLTRFAETHDTEINFLDRSDLSAWVDGLTAKNSDKPVGDKRKKDARDALARLWRYAADENIVSTTNGLTAADRIAQIKVETADQVRFLSIAEMSFILKNVTGDYLPWVVLAAFSGLRSEEIHARNYGDKKPLDWKQVKREQGHIELYKSQSKNGRRRLIPIHPTLAAWLEKINPPTTGRIVPGPPTAWQTKKLGELMDEKFKREEGWPKNCLRHTYATYRIAESQDFPRVAKEMDDSVSILKKHYDGIVTEKAGGTFWEKISQVKNF